MALWKARSLTPEQKVQLVEEESETEDFQNEEGGSFLGIEDAKMSGVFSSTKPFGVRFLIFFHQDMVCNPLCAPQRIVALHCNQLYVSLGINSHEHF